MTDITAVLGLGQDVDLLFAPDVWLENQRVYLQTHLSLLAAELDAVLSALKIKRDLQQRNLVVLRRPKRDNCRLASIEVRDLHAGLIELDKDRDDRLIPSNLSATNAEQQINVWRADGYDVDLCSERDCG